MKRCGRCEKDFDEKEFYASLSSRDGLQWSCKTCSKSYSKSYYQNNPEYVKQHARISRTRIKDRIYDYLIDHPCINCGEKNPIVLEFHHRDTSSKINNVSSMIHNKAWKSIEKEIAKCDVLCANCHRLTTETSKDSWKGKPTVGDGTTLEAWRA